MACRRSSGATSTAGPSLDLSQVYTLGGTIIPAIVSTARQSDPNENLTTMVLPPGSWYRLHSTSSANGCQVLTNPQTALDDVVAYVRAGSILVLQADLSADSNDTIQYTDMMGGTLVVEVYAAQTAGAVAKGAKTSAPLSFTLMEDDGMSLDYLTAYESSTRQTTFTYEPSTRTVAWTVAGGYNGPSASVRNNLYTHVVGVLYEANATASVRTQPVALTSPSGSVRFGSAAL